MNNVMKRTPARCVGKIVSLVGLNLDFSRRYGNRGYRVLLEQLLDAPKDSVLEVENPRARYQVNRAARQMKVRVAYASQSGKLYVKIVPNSGVPAPPQNATTPTPNFALRPEHRTLLKLLQNGPAVLKEAAQKTQMTPLACAALLSQLSARGLVEIEDGCYRLKEATSGR
jgi:predicted transcriptional regulator